MTQHKHRFEISPAVGLEHALTQRGIELIAAMQAELECSPFDIQKWRIQLYEKLLSETQSQQCMQFSPNDAHHQGKEEYDKQIQFINDVATLEQCSTPQQLDEMLSKTSGSAQTILIRTPGTVSENKDPKCHLVLLSLPNKLSDLHRSVYQSYNKCYVFVRQPFTDIQLPSNFIPIRSCVDKSTFQPTPVLSKITPADILLIASSDPQITAQALCWLQQTSATSIHLFDPFHDSPPSGQWQPTNSLTALHDTSPKARAKFYAQCGAVWVASPHIALNNHFECEAMAVGRPSLSQYTDGQTRWDPELLTTAIAKACSTPQKEIETISAGIGDWSDAIDTLRKTIDQRINIPDTHTHATSNATQINCHSVDQALSAWQPYKTKKAAGICYIFASNDWQISPQLDELLSQMKRIYTSADAAHDLLEQLQNHTARLSLRANLTELYESISDHKHPSIVLAIYIDVAPECFMPSQLPYLTIGLHIPPPIKRTRIPQALYGAGVATTITALGLHDVSHTTYQPHYWKRQERDTSFFSTSTVQRAYDDKTLNTQDIQNLLQQNKLAAFVEYSPFIKKLLLARDAWGQRPVPIIGFLHSIHSYLFYTLLHTLLHCVVHDYDCIISPSHCGNVSLQKLIDAIKRWSQDNLHVNIQFDARYEVVPYGLDPQPYQCLNKTVCRQTLKLPEDGIMILSLGRFTRSEKADLMPLLLACKELIARAQTQVIPQFYLVLAGATQDPKYLADIKRAIVVLELSAHVHVRTQVNTTDKIMLYGSADIFVAVNDSVQETYGYALVEAMASGLPVVASAWNGHREIVADRETGFLIPTYWGGFTDADLFYHQMRYKDDHHSSNDLNQSLAIDIPHLIDSLHTLITHPTKRQTFGHASRARFFKHYQLEHTSRRVLEVIEQSVASAKNHAFSKPPTQPMIDPILSRFGHYAVHSRHTDNPAILYVSTGDDAKNIKTILNLTQISDIPSIDLAHQSILLLAEHGSLELTQLVNLLSQHSLMSQPKIEANIMRLSKYNILRMHS